MKNKIVSKGAMLVVFTMVMMVICSGCGAKKELLKNQGKVECSINKQDGTRFTYEGETYIILDETVSRDEVGGWIGFIQQYVSLNSKYQVIATKEIGMDATGDLKNLAEQSKEAEYYVPYLNVFHRKGSKDKVNLIIDVENEFHRAIQVEEKKKTDQIIQFKKSSNETSDMPMINKHDARELIWGKKRYQITNKKVPEENLGEYIGILAKYLTFEADTGRVLSRKELNKIEIKPGQISKQKRISWMYGSVYKLDQETNRLAIEINDRYVYAEPID